MPSFFQFTQGTESRFRPNDTSPLLGRFRAVPPRSDLGPRRHSSLGLLAETLGNGRGSVHVGYGAVIAAELGNDAQSAVSDDDFEDGRSWGQRVWQRWIIDLWVDPRQSAVKGVLDKWWSRYGFLVLLPAALVCDYTMGHISDNLLTSARLSYGALYHFPNMSSPMMMTLKCRMGARRQVTELRECRSTFGSSSSFTTAFITLQP